MPALTCDDARVASSMSWPGAAATARAATGLPSTGVRGAMGTATRSDTGGERVGMAFDVGRVDFERFLSLSSDLLCVLLLDPELRVVYLNAGWSRELGWSTEDLDSRPLMSFVHDDDVADTRRSLDRLSAGARVVDFEMRCVHRDGTYRHLAWSAWLDREEQLIYAVARDVTLTYRRQRERRAAHQVWLALASERSLDDLGSIISEQARQLTGAIGVVTTLTAAAGSPASYCYPVDLDRPADDPAVVLVREKEGTEDLGTIEWWLADGVSTAERERLTALLTDFADVIALTLGRFRAEQVAEVALARNFELLNSISDAFYALDRNWCFTYLNAAAERALVRSSADLLGKSLWEEFPETRGTRFESAYRQAVEEAHPVAFTEHYPPLHGWFDVRAHPSAQGLAVFFIDVTGRHQVSRALEQRAHQQQAVAMLGQRALTGIAVDDLFREAVAEVQRSLQIPMVTVDELVDDGQTLQVRARTDQAPSIGARHRVKPADGTALLDALGTGSSTMADDAGAHDGQPQRPAEMVALHIDAAVPIVAGGRVWGALTVGADGQGGVDTPDVAFLQQVANVLSAALDRQHAETRLRHQADHDVLTRLPNRSLLRSRVDDEVERALLAGHDMALLLLDLDGFKDVNDHLGHAAGDTLLEHLATRLTRTIAGHGTVARLGGDEFAVCVPGPVGEADVTDLAQRILHAVEEPVTLDEMDVRVSGSIGAVLAPTYGTDSSTVLRHADVAMYRAKRAAGGSFVFYDPVTDAARGERLAMITELRSAIDSGQLELHYQPVVDMVTGRAISMEALVRWRHPTRGLMPPGGFIPLAEQTGLIGALTLWVVRRAGEQARLWWQGGIRMPVAVNISVDSLIDPAVAHEVVRLLVAAAGELTVEVTESALMNDRGRQVLADLAAANVSCAIDDFGTGYSALAYLRSLPVSAIKIDRTFITDLAHGAGVDLAIIRSVVDLATALGMEVIAEGVETAEIERKLLDAGVRRAQGFHYARPMPPSDLGPWLTASRP
ncbi:EAL domain-containing protein [Cellulomonas aerilata]|uniref:EAL domain-containing protein n=1 Tax=Cellulomonas aerilata TaxID=515326 RepID=UPI001649AB3F